MTTIHWLGAGLSSGPGIRRMASQSTPLVLWNRTLAKAEEILGASTKTPARVFGAADVEAALVAGDIVVSMLPAPMHPSIADICLRKGAHLVTTSYLSDAMRALHNAAQEKNLCFLNECGLDPGLDHMLAYKLVAEYRSSPTFLQKQTPDEHTLAFSSCCGGFPRVENDFRYKFSWSPLGVLRALRSPARAVQDGVVKNIAQPWTATQPFTLGSEKFEMYPNRDSMPYLREYGFDAAWNVRDFVRGTLRPAGWRAAWRDVFAHVESDSDVELAATADRLWKKHAYQDGEADRVVLAVSLVAKCTTGEVVFSRSYVVDECGTRDRSAMGLLVSLPATFAIDWILEGKAPVGVGGAPRDAATIDDWFLRLAREGVLLRTLES